MTLTDTHTHLYLPEFECGDEAVERAAQAGVRRMIFPNVGTDTIAPMLALHSRHPENTAVAMGLHPTEVDGAWREAYAQVLEAFDAAPGKWVAVGEIGMDLYWDKTFMEEQMQLLDCQLELAAKHGLPVIIHCREALDQTLEVFEGHKGLTGVFHSFGGTQRDVERIRNRAGDFFFGINGIVTFKKNTLPVVLPAIGAQRVLLETDSPYLAPVPMRGKRNESAFIIHTARAVADALQMDAGELARLTTESADALFRAGNRG